MKLSDYYIGTVKWFGNRTNNEQYGFIGIEKLGDAFVHKKNVKVGSLDENSIVVCSLVESQKHNGKYEAKNVYGLEYFYDIKQLTLLLSETSISSSYSESLCSQIKKILSQNTNSEEIPKNLSSFNQFILQNVSKSKSLIYNIKHIDEICSNALKLFSEATLGNQQISQKLESSIIYALYIKDLISHIGQNLLEQFYFQSDDEVKYIVATKLGPESLRDLLQKEIHLLSRKGKIPKYVELIERVKYLQESKVEINEIWKDLNEDASEELRLYLWDINSYHFFDKNIKKLLVEKITAKEYSVLMCKLNVLSDNDIVSIASDLLSLIKGNKWNDFSSFYKEFFSEIKQTRSNLYTQLNNQLINTISTNEKINLWLSDLDIAIDLEIIEENFGNLNIEDQEGCIKKVFGSPDLFPIEKALSFANRVLEKPEHIKGIGLHLALFIIQKQQQKQKVSHYDAVNVVMKRFSSTNTLYKKDNLFEKCPGRTNERGNLIQDHLSKNIIFCEGRFVIPIAKANNLSTKESPFYWCKNGKCYKNAIQKNIPDKWHNIKLFYILRRLDPLISEHDYSFKLGIINKVYIYIDHLRCRTCDGWLSPHTESNHAKSRINLFICKNEECPSKEPVYISHCLNSKCQSVIDNRDSEKCPHGWIICSTCFGCCSSEKLAVRKYIIETTTGDYDGPLNGHKDSGDIYCPECGNLFRLKSTLMLSESVREMNIWLNSIKSFKERCSNSSITKRGNPWYLIKKVDSESEEDFIKLIDRLRILGFSINKSSRENQYLITANSDRSDGILECQNTECAFRLDVNELKHTDYSRYKALIEYHKTLKLK